MSDRTAVRRSLETQSFDLLVVGGGITGVGIARDAALRGLRVALLEKGDLARGTSSASSKLIHGGLRYLELYEFGLVHESTRERALLMRNAPHLARPTSFLFPIYKDGRAGTVKVACGMWLYDALALFRNHRNHRMLNLRRIAREEPTLRREGLLSGAVYYDCMTDDGRLVVETALDAQARGATIGTYMEVTSFERDALGRVSGVRARDRLSGGDFSVKAKVTFVSVGPWTDQVLGPISAPTKRYLRPTKGVHIVLPRERLPLANAIVLTGVRDGRVIFAIPWGTRTIVGTTDTDDASSPDACEANAADVAYLLETANHYFPRLRGRREDVVSTWAGLRPLMAQEAGTASQVSREHEILDVCPGVVAIAGGKLTTYRLMAEQSVDRVLAKLGPKRHGVDERCRTEDVPLPGASDPEALADLGAFAEGLARDHALPPDVALQLTYSYGLRAPLVVAAGREAGVDPAEPIVAGLAHSWAEVAFAASHELAYRLDDVLRRRTLVFLKDHEHGLGAAARTAEIMGRVHGWDAARRAEEVARFREVVAAQRAFRGEPARAEPVGVT